MTESIYLWIAFIGSIILLLAIDLGVFHRKSHEVKISEALMWTAIWVSLALSFDFFIYHYFGQVKALEFLTGYLIEESLSVDNLFVFILLFKFFAVDPRYQHKVLFWGIIGALVLRGMFIFTGVALIENFHWLIYIFGAFLVFTGISTAFSGETKIKPEKNPVVRLFKKFFRFTSEDAGNKFFIKKNKLWYATPLFVVLIVVEFTDLIFAVDSIPAILAISNDTFIIFSSNVFAILGLRSLYFALAGITKYFYYLKYGLAAILFFVGLKMIVSYIYIIPINISLLVIFCILLLSVLISVLYKKEQRKN